MLSARRNVAMAIAAAASLVVIQSASAGAIVAPEGSYTIPVVQSTIIDKTSLEFSTEIAGESDGYVIRWSAPEARTFIGDSRDFGFPIAASGPYLAGIREDGSGASLTAMDLRDATVVSRPLPAGNWEGAGVTSTSWILWDASKVTALPFDELASARDLTPSQGQFMTGPGVAVGQAGVVYVAKVVVDSAVSYRLMLAAPDLQSDQQLVDLGATLPTAVGAVQIVITGDAVAWKRNDTRQLGYVEIGGSPSTVTLPSMFASSPIAVQHGAVALVSLGKLYLWAPGAPAPSTAVTLSGQVEPPVHPAATTAGDPAFAVDRVSSTTGLPLGWQVVAPDGSVVSTDAGWPRRTEILQLQAAPGRALVQLDGLTASDSTAPIVVYSLGNGSATKLYTLDRATGRGEGPSFAASGNRTSVLEPVGGDGASVLKLRNGTSLTASVPIPASVMVTALVASGPWTALARSDWSTGAQTVTVLAPDGTPASTFSAGAWQLAMDGRWVAWMPMDGSVWVRNTAAVAAAGTNPRRILAGCSAGSEYCRTWIGLSAGRLLVSTDQPPALPTLRAYDARTGALLSTATFEAGPYRTFAVNGDFVAMADERAVYAADLASPEPQFVEVADMGWPDVEIAGTDLLWPVRLEDGETISVAPHQSGWGDVGAPRLLGVWARYGSYASTAGPAWAPAITVSGALSSWTLTLRNAAGSVVRTWTSATGTATGQLSGVSFDARGSNGTALPVGTYRWALTGDGPQGSPVGLFGTGTVAGTVAVVKQVRGSVTINAPSSVRKGATASITGKVVAYGTTKGIANEPVSLWRRIGATGTWAKVADGVTGSTGTATWKVRIDRSAYYQVRHVSTPRVGACSSPARLIAAS